MQRPTQVGFSYEAMMKIHSAVFHPNGFFIDAPNQPDFWVLLSRTLGWGRFSLVCESDEFTPDGGIFELVEVLPAGSEPPSPLIPSSNVLWRLPEAAEALKRYSVSQIRECLPER